MMDERKATVAILTHVLHRLNEFFTGHPAESFSTEQDVGAAFLEFLGTADMKQAVAFEEELRRLLWAYHGCEGRFRYGDDGELQCQSCMIDFKRTAIRQLGHDLFSWKAALGAAKK